MNDTKDTFPEVLKSIENVLLADKATVRESLQAAYRIGKLDGMLEILENEKVKDETIRGHPHLGR